MLLLIYILLLFNVLAPNVSFWYALFPKFAILCKHLLSSGKCDLSDISWGRAVLCWYIIGGAKSCQITANNIGRENWRKRTAGPRWCEARRGAEEVRPRVDLHLFCSQEVTASRRAKSCDPITSWTSRSRKILTTAAVAGNLRGWTVHCTWFRCGDVLWRSVMFGRAQSEVIGVKLAGCGYITSNLVNL